MPEIKITDLPLATTVASTDLCVVVADPSTTPTTKKTLASTLPVSTATQTALNLKAPTASPTFTGIVTTAGQIAFPTVFNPSSNANTLDDYEEGTFSINWGTGTSVNENFQYKVAQYIKIGKTVYIQVGMPLLNNYYQSGGNSGNAVSFIGLPFSSAAVGAGGYGALSIGYQSGYSTRVDSGYISAGITPAASVTIYIFDAAGNSITNAMVSATLSNLYFTAFYTTTT